MLRHQRHLLEAAETKHGARLAAFIDGHYTDRWGHDKPFVVRQTSEILRQFFVLTIRNETVAVAVNGPHATVSAQLKLDGQGTAFAAYAQQAVNGLREPFVFAWTRVSWKPWDWQLIRVDQPELRLGEWEN